MLLRIFAVMRDAVESGGGRFALRIRAAGEIAREQQRAHAGDVRLERQRQQIELELDVLVESLRHAHRHRHIRRRDGRGLHGDLQPPLDLADVLGVVVEPRAVGGARFAAQPRETAGQRVQNAAVALSALGALLRRAAVSEHALEDHLRIQLHRQRIGRRGPGDGVGVGATITLAAVARIRAGVLDRELHGRHQVILADLLRDHLIDGGARVYVGAGGLLGLVRAQERGGHPVVGAGRAGRRFSRAGMQAAHDHGLFTERLQRLPVEGKRGVQRAFFVGNPIAGRHAVRHKAADKARLRGGRGLRQRRGRPESSRPEAAAPASRRRHAEPSGGKCVFW